MFLLQVCLLALVGVDWVVVAFELKSSEFFSTVSYLKRVGDEETSSVMTREGI